MSGNPDVLVLGGGLVGLAVAHALAGRGVDVELIEARQTGAAASSAAAGLLAPISDWESTEPFVELCRRARDAWRAWLDVVVAESGVPVEYDDSGCLLAALEPEDLAWLDDEERIAGAAGESWRELPVVEVRRLVPDLEPRTIRVGHLPGEHRVDNAAACVALVAAGRRRGVAIRQPCRVQRVEVGRRSVRVELGGETREAGTLVLAAGAWSASVAGLPRLPVHPVRGQMLRLEGAHWSWGGSLRWRHNYVVRRGSVGLLVGATVEEAGFDEHPTASGIAGLLGFSRRLLPGLADARLESTWAGLRPGSPDGRPILGRIDDGPIVAACGHYRNGILLAPWSGEAIARLIVDGIAIDEAALFAPERFANPAG